MISINLNPLLDWQHLYLVVAVVCVTLLFLLSGLSFSPIPGPRWHFPGLGEIIEFADNPVKFVFRRYKKYGKIYRSYLFGKEIIMIGDKDLLRTDLGNEDAVGFVLPIETANEILDVYNMVEQHRHKSFRRSMLHALSPVHVKARYPMLRSILVDHVSRWLEQDSMEVDRQLRKMVVHVALTAVMGFELEPQLLAKLTDLALTVQGGLFAFPINLPGTAWNKSKQKKQEYIDLLSNVIAARFGVDPATGAVIAPSPEQLSLPGAMDTTHAILNEFREMDDVGTPARLAGRIVQNAVGASETTANTMLGCIVAFALNPSVMEKLRKEQAHVVASHGPEMPFEVVQQHMPYLDAAVREATRVLPTTHTLCRQARRDLNLGGHAVKKGSFLIIATDLLHALDSSCWDGQPCDLPCHVDTNRLTESFKPERWLDESQKPPSVYTFSFGPHACPGMNLAIMEIKTMLALLLRQAAWQLLDRKPCVKFLPQIRLASGPVNVRFIKSPLPQL